MASGPRAARGRPTEGVQYTMRQCLCACCRHYRSAEQRHSNTASTPRQPLECGTHRALPPAFAPIGRAASASPPHSPSAPPARPRSWAAGLHRAAEGSRGSGGGVAGAGGRRRAHACLPTRHARRLTRAGAGVAALQACVLRRDALRQQLVQAEGADVVCARCREGRWVRGRQAQRAGVQGEAGLCTLPPPDPPSEPRHTQPCTHRLCAAP